MEKRDRPVFPGNGLEGSFRCPAILLGPLYHMPGTGDALAASLEQSDPESAGLVRAFLLYYRGDSSAAAAQARALLQAGCRLETRLGACHVLSLEALFLGDVKKWETARELIAKSEYTTDEEYTLKEFNLAALDSSLFVKATFPAWFREGCFDPLPVECFGIARYLYAKLLFMESRFTELAVVVEPFISQSRAEKEPLSEIYLRIIAAMGRYCTGESERAEGHLRRALELALPDRLYSPFAEYRRHLGTLLDKVLREMDADALRVVIGLNHAVQEGWTALYNALYDKKYTNDLTRREYDAARFALLDKTNGEIAATMDVSVNAVKLYLRNAYEKLGINRRDELAPYIWDER